MRPTQRQQEILDVLRQHAAESGLPLTLDGLCALLGLRSRGSLHKHLKALVAAGLVEPMDGRRRGIRPIPQAPEPDELPFLGRIVAGRPIESVAQGETMRVAPGLRTDKSCYVLQVVGDSMRDAGILDGDFVVVEHRHSARNGQIVVALIRGQESTLKRIRQEPGKVTLVPANPEHEALSLSPEEVEIQGVLVGQMRRYP